jgi:hypothetical protein
MEGGGTMHTSLWFLMEIKELDGGFVESNVWTKRDVSLLFN